MSERYSPEWEEEERYKRNAGFALWKHPLQRVMFCELCGRCAEPDRATGKKWKQGQGCLVAHHAYGYDRPLDVWHICRSCNSRLKGKEWHNGTKSREDARCFLGQPTRAVRAPCAAQAEMDRNFKVGC